MLIAMLGHKQSLCKPQRISFTLHANQCSLHFDKPQKNLRNFHDTGSSFNKLCINSTLLYIIYIVLSNFNGLNTFGTMKISSRQHRRRKMRGGGGGGGGGGGAGPPPNNLRGRPTYLLPPPPPPHPPIIHPPFPSISM